MQNDQAEHMWRSSARRTARQINTGWWMDCLAPWLIGVSALAAVAILLSRTFFPDTLGHREFVWTATGILGVSAVLGWLIARGKFVSEDEGLVRLEDKLQLNNALTTARDGRHLWPATTKIESSKNGLSWNWPRLLTPVGIAIAFFALSTLVPVFPLQAVPEDPPSEPAAWEQMEDWLDKLEEEEIVEEKSIEELKDAVTELRDQPEDEWFSHSSLEATDTMRQSMKRDLENMASDLATVERDMDALQNFSSQMSDAGKEALLKEMDDAMSSLQASSLPLNEELRKQLANLDPSQLSQVNISQLSQQQMKALQNALKKASEALGSMKGLGECECESLEAMMARLGKAGRGGITRGPGEAPMFFGEKTDLKTNRIETVQNNDLSRVTPGDLLGTGEGQHGDEKVEEGSRVGGDVSSVGSGGDTVWRESLLPSEKAVLKKYFD